MKSFYLLTIQFYSVIKDYFLIVGLESGKAMGCYQDDKALRLLTGFYQNLKTTNSPQTCLDICTKGGFPFAGVQYGYVSSPFFIF